MWENIGLCGEGLTETEFMESSQEFRGKVLCVKLFCKY